VSNIAKRDQNYLNHVAFVLDRSGSMQHLRSQVPKVLDGQIAGLVQSSISHKQETRASVYVFDDNVDCVYYDKSVHDFPTMVGKYQIGGTTALVDATLLAMDELAHTWEGRADHSFLLFVITDGYENASKRPYAELHKRLSTLPDNWTVGCLVPNVQSIQSAKALGFATGNIMVWDATSERGLVEASRQISVATASYMTDRAAGKRSTKTLFTIDDSKLSVDAAKAANLKQLDQDEYVIMPVIRDCTIKEFVEEATTNYRVGLGYYQLNNSKTPKGKKGIIIQGNKDILVMENATKKVFGGKEARQLVGLPEHDITVDPMNMGRDHVVFVQSTSVNRNLYAGTKFLLRNRRKVA
jgi:hypothetical protein